jgi:hypothetical protein
MANILVVIGRVLCVLGGCILAVLVWKTTEYFDRLPANDKNRPLIAWDALMLFIMMLLLVMKLSLI